MGYSTRLGRPRKNPETPLGALIVNRMDARGISGPMLAKRLNISRATLWRFLNGKEETSRRITIESLCRALDLIGHEQSAFVQACASFIKGGGRIEDDAPGAEETGRAANVLDDSYMGSAHPDDDSAPTLKFGRFLGACLQAKGSSQSWLASQLNVAPSTISRLARGKLATTHAVDVDSMCHALELNVMDRRTFLALAAEASLLPIVYRATPVQLRFRPLEQSIGQSLEQVEHAVSELRERRNQGDVAASYRDAKALFEALFETPIAAPRLMKSPEFARAKLLVGFEYCEAQGAYLGWYNRVPMMIETLTRMETEVILYFPPKVFASEYGHLFNLRGPLYYKQRDASPVADQFGECIAELTRALENLRWYFSEHALQVELLRNRAHAYLLQGNTQAWKVDLEMARHVASGIQGHERETFQALVEYSWGEGYKRLASWRALTTQERRFYANKALHALPEGAAVFQRHHNWEGYELLARIGEAQSLILYDADEALRRVELLRANAAVFYPSLLAKIDRVASAAERHKQATFRQ